MKATHFEFRFRLIIIILLYAVGFWAPRHGWRSRRSLSRTGWLPLEQATVLVTLLAILCGLAGAVLRVWGTAYLSAGVVHSGAMHGEQMMAAGPYRYVRNPLYLGSYFMALSIAILMPPSGAAVFVVAIGVFYLRLILAEEAFLAGQIGEAYVEYKKQVPRLIPSLRPRMPDSAARPQWLNGFLAEALPVGYPVCLAVLAWRYEPLLLDRCLLICFGLSLVTRAFIPKKQATTA